MKRKTGSELNETREKERKRKRQIGRQPDTHRG
jgi:hypothetical protein